MKEKKKSSNWFIAATHYLTAGFAIPFLIGIVANFILIPLIKLGSITLLMLFAWVVKILAIWLGIMYSANYLKKTYIIDDKEKIVNLSTIYFVVLNVGYTLIQIIIGKIVGSDIAYFLLFVIVASFLFYLFSKKHIQNTDAVASQPQQNIGM